MAKPNAQDTLLEHDRLHHLRGDTLTWPAEQNGDVCYPSMAAVFDDLLLLMTRPHITVNGAFGVYPWNCRIRQIDLIEVDNSSSLNVLRALFYAARDPFAMCFHGFC
jgi:hypothetical protein